MSVVQTIRERLRNPPNAVPDLGIDLKRRHPAPPEPVSLTMAPPPNAPPRAAVVQHPPRDLPTSLWIKRRKPNESDADFIERQITHHRGRLERAIERREKLFGKRHAPRIEDIQDAVCTVYRVEKHEMLSRRRTAYLVRPRHVAMYLSKVMTGLSYPGIGRKFSDRDHTTVIHAVQKITRDRVTDQKLRVMIARVEDMFASPDNPEDVSCNCQPKSST